MATPHSLPNSPSRRVLGDVTPKSINSPRIKQEGLEAFGSVRAQSPLKQVVTHTPVTFADKENFPTANASVKGKKRGIEEVDDAEVVDHSKMLARGRDVSLLNTGMGLTFAAMTRHTENNPANLTDPGSPTERNTPTPEPEPMPNTQNSNQSFSDLLNYDLCASQKSDQATAPEPAPTSAPISILVPAANDEKKSRAENLRTRLKFGLYKMKTNQVGKRDAEIISTYELSTSQSSLGGNASRSSLGMTTSHDSDSAQVPNITISSPRRVQTAAGPVFVQANLDPFRPIGKLGAAPVLFAPPRDGTQISSRMVSAYSNLSSSPPSPALPLPQSVSPEQLMSPVRPRNAYQTPTRIRMGEQDDEDVMMGASYMDSGMHMTPHERLQRLKEQKYLEGDLTSSAVKGNAAKGLLSLMHAKR